MGRLLAGVVRAASGGRVAGQRVPRAAPGGLPRRATPPAGQRQARQHTASAAYRLGDLGARRVHLAGCTAHPTAQWVTLQARQRSWEFQDGAPVAERSVRSVRQEWLDRLLIVDEGRVRRVLLACVAHPNQTRLHQGPDQRAPVPQGDGGGAGSAAGRAGRAAARGRPGAARC